MNRINTEIEHMAVEIDEKEYQLAEKTIEVAEKLIDAAKKFAGQPEYKLWFAELEILLGKNAVRELFPLGKKENIDRLYRIHTGVLEAFDYNADSVEAEKMEKQRDKIADVAELLKQIVAAAKIDDHSNMDVIRRK